MERPETVAGFAQSPPNPVLMELAAHERRKFPNPRAIDLGCGAGRNAVPMAEDGWTVLGVDDSAPMLLAAHVRAATAGVSTRVQLALAEMDHLPLRDASVDFVVAHGIWNLARSSDEFRRAVREAARVAREGSALFVFTFSRRTLPADASPVVGETFVFTQFSGEPQCFLTEEQLVKEMAAAGFALDNAVPMRELNIPKPGALCARPAPVIWEAAFRKR